MKFVLAAILLFSGAQASALTCVDVWGNPVSVKFKKGGVKLYWSKGKASLKDSGLWGNKYYFRDRDEGVAIVDASIMSTGKGRITYLKQKRRKDGGRLPIRFYCN